MKIQEALPFFYFKTTNPERPNHFQRNLKSPKLIRIAKSHQFPFANAMK